MSTTKENTQEQLSSPTVLSRDAVEYVGRLAEEGRIARVQDEKEYWTQHKYYKKQFRKLMMKSPRYMLKPWEFIEAFERLVAEMEFVGVVNKTFAEQQRARLYREMRMPEEFKAWSAEKKETIKKRLKSIIKKQ